MRVLRKKAGKEPKAGTIQYNPRLIAAWLKGALKSLPGRAKLRKIPVSEYKAKLSTIESNGEFCGTEEFYRELASEITDGLLAEYPDGADAEDKSRSAALEFFSKNNALMYGFIAAMNKSSLYEEITESNFINSCPNIDQYARETAASMMDDFILDEFEKRWTGREEEYIDK